MENVQGQSLHTTASCVQTPGQSTEAGLCHWQPQVSLSDPGSRQLVERLEASRFDRDSDEQSNRTTAAMPL